MAVSTLAAITENTLNSLYFIHKYRYLSITQVARITGLKTKTVSENLLRLERQKLLGSFGNTGNRGYGKTPKMYYLKKRGYELLLEETDSTPDQVGAFREVNITSKWSPKMWHRLATINVLMSLEASCLATGTYRLPAVFLEYRREVKSGQWVAETTDHFGEGQGASTIVPDAGFVLENSETEKRALFLIEVDMGTERQVTALPQAEKQSFKYKLAQYDRYLASGNFKAKYQPWGDFGSFIMLTITTGAQRVENMRTKLSDLSEDYHRFYRFSTLEEVKENFFHGNWYTRDNNDTEAKPLIKMGG